MSDITAPGQKARKTMKTNPMSQDAQRVPETLSPTQENTQGDGSEDENEVDPNQDPKIL